MNQGFDANSPDLFVAVCESASCFDKKLVNARIATCIQRVPQGALSKGAQWVASY
jgi:hypothetical protein